MTAAPAHISLTVDEASTAWLADLNARLSAVLELAERPVEITRLVGDLPDGAAMFHTKTVPAGNAGEFRLILEPCDGLLALMAALRALDGECDRVGELVGHDDLQAGNLVSAAGAQT